VLKYASRAANPIEISDDEEDNEEPLVVDEKSGSPHAMQ
jgi:hypothetical protein